jgi:hypothetical protein
MKNITYIYLIENIEPGANKVYIGKTKNSREKEHKKRWGNQITYTIIDKINSLDRKEWKPLETYWIHQFKQWGFELLNCNDGGGGMEYATDEFKIKISNINKGRHIDRTVTWNDKISQAKKGKKLGPMSNEHKESIRKGTTGRLMPGHSEETKQKMTGIKKPGTSQALKGRVYSAETIMKMKIARAKRKVF